MVWGSSASLRRQREREGERERERQREKERERDREKKIERTYIREGKRKIKNPGEGFKVSV